MFWSFVRFIAIASKLTAQTLAAILVEQTTRDISEEKKKREKKYKTIIKAKWKQ